METKKRGFKKKLDSFHQTSWNFGGISTVVCDSFWGLKKSKWRLLPWYQSTGARSYIFTSPGIWVCPTNSDFFGLSRSTRCGGCSYQVSSISVWRVTCYDHFCVFQFFCILTASMATVYDIPTRFHKVWSRHLREIERTKMCGRIIIIRIIIIVKKKRRIAIRHPTAFKWLPLPWKRPKC
jgi:hypothetical protein